MFIPIKKILPKAINQLGIAGEATAAYVCEKYRLLAPRHIHTNALKHTFPKSFRMGVLTVGVSDSAWAQQIVSKKTKLLEAINEALAKKLIKEVKTRVTPRSSFPLLGAHQDTSGKS